MSGRRRESTAANRQAASPLQIEDLCKELESYLDPKDIADVRAAYHFGACAHEGQCRVSGEPYITHPLEVAHMLASMHMDAKSLMAAILHDVIEDTKTAKERLAQEFGKDVAELVDGVSKITRIEFQSQEEAQAENFRKMLLAMASDIRVILIKLADRLHNMRTIGFLPRDRQVAIARETIDIYAPIANRLGVRQWATELEDLAMGTLVPLRYNILNEAIRKRRANRKAIVEKVRTAIVSQLQSEGMIAEVTGREKNVYSIYKKMQQKKLPFEQIHDVYGFRIIVDKADSCYRVLGMLHSLYKPIPGRFKDYIAIPKANGYQSLHTVVFGPFGVSIELQIRTREMHRVAEAGVASHWLYKSGDNMRQFALEWLKDLLEIQQKAGNPHEFLEHLKVDLFPDEVYIFTPQGDIKKLPRGATVIDFAYDVHTDIGTHCVGAKVNNELVPLRTTLRNGDRVEILTSPSAYPSPVWLDYVVTGKARAHIRSSLKSRQIGGAVELGGRLLDAALQDMGVDPSELTDAQRNELLASVKLPNWNQLLSDIGLGNRAAAVVARQLTQEAPEEIEESGFAITRRFRKLLTGTRTQSTTALGIRGTEGVVVTYGRCCRPIPGDPILGFLSAGRGIVVHTEDCHNVAKYRKRPDQWIDVRWEQSIERVFPVTMRLHVRNQRGALASIAAAIADQDANIDTVSFDDRDGRYTTMEFTVEVKDRVHLANVMRRVRALDSVARINRKKG